MNKKTTDMVAYVTWVGLLIAFIAGDRENSKFHLNQALVIWLVGFLSVIPIVGWIIGIAAFVFAVIFLANSSNFGWNVSVSGDTATNTPSKFAV